MKLRSLLAGAVFIAGCSRQDACGIRDIHDGGQKPICGNAVDSRSNGGNGDGKALFMTHCAACHDIRKDATGPALWGVDARWNNDDSALVRYIRYADKPKQARRKYIRQLREKWQAEMPGFPNLTNQQVRAILTYVSIQ